MQFVLTGITSQVRIQRLINLLQIPNLWETLSNHANHPAVTPEESLASQEL